MIDSDTGKTHLTGMNAQTTLSGKGQVVIPKDVRDALGLIAGQKLDVVQSGNSILLRPVLPKSGRTTDEIFAHLLELAPKWEGPPVSIEEMNRAVDAMVAARTKDDI